MALVLYEILRAGGLGTGGFNFDTKLRRQSLARDDLFHGHVGAIDTLARALLVAASLVESDDLERHRRTRYAGWDGPLGTSILGGTASLPDLHRVVTDGGLDPEPVSGRQELLENLVNRHIERAR
jgi:xylose isomerase